MVNLHVMLCSSVYVCVCMCVCLFFLCVNIMKKMLELIQTGPEKEEKHL